MVEKAEIGKVYWDLSTLKKAKDLKEAAVEFEAYLFNSFLKEALKPLEGGLLGKGFQATVYRELFCMTLSEELSQTDPLNLSHLFESALKAYGRVGER